jgi:YgiT-type zinc finger domain-containing protein
MMQRSEPPVVLPCTVCHGQMQRGETPYLIETMSGPMIIEHVPVVRCLRCGRKTFDPEVMDQITAMLLGIEHGTLTPPKVPTGRVQYAR